MLPGCCSVLQCMLQCMLQCVAVCCSVLQCVAVCCSGVLCVAGAQGHGRMWSRLVFWCVAVCVEVCVAVFGAVCCRLSLGVAVRLRIIMINSYIYAMTALLRNDPCVAYIQLYV